MLNPLKSIKKSKDSCASSSKKSWCVRFYERMILIYRSLTKRHFDDSNVFTWSGFKGLARQKGRSMIEIIAVILIMGLLSIAGLVLYRLSMNHHHANQVVDDVERLALTIYHRIDSVPKGIIRDEAFTSKSTEFSANSSHEYKGQLANTGYNGVKDSKNGFYIDVSNVPIDECTVLIPKAESKHMMAVMKGRPGNSTKEAFSYVRGESDVAQLCTPLRENETDVTVRFYFNTSGCEACKNGMSSADCCNGCQCPNGTVCKSDTRNDYYRENFRAKMCCPSGNNIVNCGGRCVDKTCPDGSTFKEESCSCDSNVDDPYNYCVKVEIDNCDTYDEYSTEAECPCKVCKSGYILVDGICVSPYCTVSRIEGCVKYDTTSREATCPCLEYDCVVPDRTTDASGCERQYKIGHGYSKPNQECPFTCLASDNCYLSKQNPPTCEKTYPCVPPGDGVLSCCAPDPVTGVAAFNTEARYTTEARNCPCKNGWVSWYKGSSPCECKCPDGMGRKKVTYGVEWCPAEDCTSVPTPCKMPDPKDIGCEAYDETSTATYCPCIKSRTKCIVPPEDSDFRYPDCVAYDETKAWNINDPYCSCKTWKCVPNQLVWDDDGYECLQNNASQTYSARYTPCPCNKWRKPCQAPPKSDNVCRIPSESVKNADPRRDWNKKIYWITSTNKTANDCSKTGSICPCQSGWTDRTIDSSGNRKCLKKCVPHTTTTPTPPPWPVPNGCCFSENKDVWTESANASCPCNDVRTEGPCTTQNPEGKSVWPVTVNGEAKCCDQEDTKNVPLNLSTCEASACACKRINNNYVVKDGKCVSLTTCTSHDPMPYKTTAGCCIADNIGELCVGSTSCSCSCKTISPIMNSSCEYYCTHPSKTPSTCNANTMADTMLPTQAEKNADPNRSWGATSATACTKCKCDTNFYQERNGKCLCIQDSNHTVTNCKTDGYDLTSAVAGTCPCSKYSCVAPETISGGACLSYAYALSSSRVTTDPHRLWSTAVSSTATNPGCTKCSCEGGWTDSAVVTRGVTGNTNRCVKKCTEHTEMWIDNGKCCIEDHNQDYDITERSCYCKTYSTEFSVVDGVCKAHCVSPNTNQLPTEAEKAADPNRDWDAMYTTAGTVCPCKTITVKKVSGCNGLSQQADYDSKGTRKTEYISNPTYTNVNVTTVNTTVGGSQLCLIPKDSFGCTKNSDCAGYNNANKMSRNFCAFVCPGNASADAIGGSDSALGYGVCAPVSAFDPRGKLVPQPSDGRYRTWVRTFKNGGLYSNTNKYGYTNWWTSRNLCQVLDLDLATAAALKSSGCSGMSTVNTTPGGFCTNTTGYSYEYDCHKLNGTLNENDNYWCGKYNTNLRRLQRKNGDNNVWRSLSDTTYTNSSTEPTGWWNHNRHWLKDSSGSGNTTKYHRFGLTGCGETTSVGNVYSDENSKFISALCMSATEQPCPSEVCTKTCKATAVAWPDPEQRLCCTENDTTAGVPVTNDPCPCKTYDTTQSTWIYTEDGNTPKCKRRCVSPNTNALPTQAEIDADPYRDWDALYEAANTPCPCKSITVEKPSCSEAKYTADNDWLNTPRCKEYQSVPGSMTSVTVTATDEVVNNVHYCRVPSGEWGCTKNSDCKGYNDSTILNRTFCSFPCPSNTQKGIGRCAPVSYFAPQGKIVKQKGSVLPNAEKIRWVRSSLDVADGNSIDGPYGKMNYWTAQNWCSALGMQMATAAVLKATDCVNMSVDRDANEDVPSDTSNGGFCTNSAAVAGWRPYQWMCNGYSSGGCYGYEMCGKYDTNWRWIQTKGSKVEQDDLTGSAVVRWSNAGRHWLAESMSGDPDPAIGDHRNSDSCLKKNDKGKIVVRDTCLNDDMPQITNDMTQEEREAAINARTHYYVASLTGCGLYTARPNTTRMQNRDGFSNGKAYCNTYGKVVNALCMGSASATNHCTSHNGVWPDEEKGKCCLTDNEAEMVVNAGTLCSCESWDESETEWTYSVENGVAKCTKKSGGGDPPPHCSVFGLCTGGSSAYYCKFQEGSVCSTGGNCNTPDGCDRVPADGGDCSAWSLEGPTSVVASNRLFVRSSAAIKSIASARSWCKALGQRAGIATGFPLVTDETVKNTSIGLKNKLTSGQNYWVESCTGENAVTYTGGSVSSVNRSNTYAICDTGCVSGYVLQPDGTCTQTPTYDIYTFEIEGGQQFSWKYDDSISELADTDSVAALAASKTWCTNQGLHLITPSDLNCPNCTPSSSAKTDVAWLIRSTSYASQYAANYVGNTAYLRDGWDETWGMFDNHYLMDFGNTGSNVYAVSFQNRGEFVEMDDRYYHFPMCAGKKCAHIDNCAIYKNCECVFYSCSENSDCKTQNEFCAFQNTQTVTEGSNARSDKGVGLCLDKSSRFAIDAAENTGGKIITTTGVGYSNTQWNRGMQFSWWTAKNWCSAFGGNLITLSDLNKAGFSCSPGSNCYIYDYVYRWFGGSGSYGGINYTSWFDSPAEGGMMYNFAQSLSSDYPSSTYVGAVCVRGSLEEPKVDCETAGIKCCDFVPSSDMYYKNVCSATEFCLFYSTNLAGETATDSTVYGICQPIGSYPSNEVTVLDADHKYVRSTDKMNWWSAQSWCYTRGLSPAIGTLTSATRASVGCPNAADPQPTSTWPDWWTSFQNAVDDLGTYFGISPETPFTCTSKTLKAIRGVGAWSGRGLHWLEQPADFELAAYTIDLTSIDAASACWWESTLDACWDRKEPIFSRASKGSDAYAFCVHTETPFTETQTSVPDWFNFGSLWGTYGY